MSEPVWVPLGATAVPKAVYPIDFRNPMVQAFAGMTYPVVSALTGWESWSWGFSPTGEGWIFGVFRLPENAPNPATASLKFDFHAATAGAVSLQMSMKGISDGESMNISAWDWTWGPGTRTLAARTRLSVTAGNPVLIPTHLQPGDLGIVAIGRRPADAADVNASVLELLSGALVID